jgi:phytoene dehydrogenase-like protein
MQRRVTIIGGGLAGLTAAVTAARAGASVTVHEARSGPGGRARTTRADGFALNQGAHALYWGMPAARVLGSFGIQPRGGRPPASPAYGRLRGEIGLLPGTPRDLVRSRLVGLRAKGQLAVLLADPRRSMRRPTEGRSMAAWIDEQVSHPDARLLLRMAARTATYQADLDELDAAAGVRNLVAALTDGVRYLDGGWQQLVEALRVVAERAGAKIVHGDKVTSIDELTDTDTVIIAAGGPAAVSALLGARSTAAARWAAEAKPVVASALDLGLRGLPCPERRFVLGVDEAWYVSAHTPTAHLAEDSGEVVHVLAYGEVPDPREQMEGFLDAAQPGWREHVVTEQVGRRLVVAHGRPLPGAGLRGRPGPGVPDCPDVFVAGDWVGAEGLLADAAVSSGAAAGRMAAGTPR